MVIAGRSKGKIGEVLRVLAAEQRVVVSGVNIIKRHTKPSRAEPGGIIETEAAIHVSNVALLDPEDRQADQGRLQVPRRRPEGALRARLRRNHRPLGERAMPARLQEHYTKTVREALTKEFSYKNAFEVPKLDKIVINMGVGEAVNDRKAVDGAVAELTAITGQKPVITKSRKSIATFKLREGMAIGAKVTLRRDRMYEFLDRLINIALPRVRDFRGLNGKSFDGRGNYAMGLKEQLVFPEIDYDKVDQVRGMDIIICTTAKTDAEAKALLRAFDFPFVN